LKVFNKGEYKLEFELFIILINNSSSLFYNLYKLENKLSSLLCIILLYGKFKLLEFHATILPLCIINALPISKPLFETWIFLDTFYGYKKYEHKAII